MIILDKSYQRKRSSSEESSDDNENTCMTTEL